MIAPLNLGRFHLFQDSTFSAVSPTGCQLVAHAVGIDDLPDVEGGHHALDLDASARLVGLAAGSVLLEWVLG